MKRTHDQLRTSFMQIYPNLPLFERKSPCIVMKVNGQSEPISWNVCYIEIKNNTELSKNILKIMGELEFI